MDRITIPEEFLIMPPEEKIRPLTQDELAKLQALPSNISAAYIFEILKRKQVPFMNGHGIEPDWEVVGVEKIDGKIIIQVCPLNEEAGTKKDIKNVSLSDLLSWQN